MIGGSDGAVLRHWRSALDERVGSRGAHRRGGEVQARLEGIRGPSRTGAARVRGGRDGPRRISRSRDFLLPAEFFARGVRRLYPRAVERAARDDGRAAEAGAAETISD